MTPEQCPVHQIHSCRTLPSSIAAYFTSQPALIVFYTRQVCRNWKLDSTCSYCKAPGAKRPRSSSVGNFFFAGARTFFNSLEAAIFLFSRVARIPEGSSVMPVISTEERITLGAVLSNGLVIKGQNQISHPSMAGNLLLTSLMMLNIAMLLHVMRLCR